LEQYLGCTAGAQPAGSTVALIRCYNSAKGDHMVSVGESCDAGYVVEQQLGAAFMHGDDVETGFALPLYRCRHHFESHEPKLRGPTHGS